MLVQNKGNYVRHAEGVMLVPGSNEVKPEDWEKFSAHPIIESLIEKEEIVPALSENKTEGNGTADSTKDMNATEAINLVEDTWSLELLSKWEEEEDRKTVKDAIAKQVEKIKGEDDPKDDE